jgi:NADH:ubiquinone oxidoreductase subunit 5 (subunit L)/multisubunit Na+/H+ antiporter MnhA subunit
MAKIGKTRSPIGVWALTLVSLGIYGYVHWYKVNREMREYDSSVEVSPAKAVLALIPGALLCGIPPLVSMYNTGERANRAQTRAGINPSASGAMTLVLGILLGFQGFYVQDQLNKIWAEYPNAAEGDEVPHTP